MILYSHYLLGGKTHQVALYSVILVDLLLYNYIIFVIKSCVLNWKVCDVIFARKQLAKLKYIFWKKPILDIHVSGLYTKFYFRCANLHFM